VNYGVDLDIIYIIYIFIHVYTWNRYVHTNNIYIHIGGPSLRDDVPPGSFSVSEADEADTKEVPSES